jgi:hypothetical protein
MQRRRRLQVLPSPAISVPTAFRLGRHERSAGRRPLPGSVDLLDWRVRKRTEW